MTWAVAGFAQTNLTVVRHSDNTIWAMLCEGLTCSSWTKIPGGFSTQPTLTWDPALNKYILIGIGNNGSNIWRSTFNADGTWNNDWALIGTGATGSPSPVAVTGGDFSEMIWTGVWSASQTYQPYDVVSYNGSSYISLSGNNTAVPTDTQHWSMLAQKGDQGAQGNQGPQGSVGATGPQGPPGPAGPGVANIYTVVNNNPTNIPIIIASCNSVTDYVVGGGVHCWNKYFVNQSIPVTIGSGSYPNAWLGSCCSSDLCPQGIYSVYAICVTP